MAVPAGRDGGRVLQRVQLLPASMSPETGEYGGTGGQVVHNNSRQVDARHSTSALRALPLTHILCLLPLFAAKNPRSILPFSGTSADADIQSAGRFLSLFGSNSNDSSLTSCLALKAERRERENPELE